MSLLAQRHHEDRPWGSFERFTCNELSTVKIIAVEPGATLSLQRHARRAEFWRILSGAGEVTLDSIVREAKAGDEFEVPVGTVHRVSAGPEGLTLLEIALGTFDEDDITRLDDKYGRSSPPA
jgi:mannose-6-phosphate isomerase-like protein (cupin superfamily)